MASIEVRGTFDMEACVDCPKQDDCAAFGLVTNMSSRLGLDDDIEAVKRRFNAAADSLSFNPTAGGRSAAEASMKVVSTRFNGILAKAALIQDATTQIVGLAVKAQLEPESFKTNDDFKHHALDSIRIGFERELDPTITLEQIDQIGSDVRYYASTGVCGAIEVIEVV